MATTDFYPDAHPETSSVDGYASRALVSESWSTIRSGAGVSSDDSGITLVAAGVYNASILSNAWYALRRILLVFDTSSIPSDATIVSATLTVRCASKSNRNSWSDSAAGLALVGSTPASNTAIAASDYGQTGSTRFATDKNYSDFTAGSDTTFTLNSSGLAAIGKGTGGRTKLALRHVADLDNTNPPHAFGGTTTVILVGAENTNDPKLTVTYTTPATAEVTKVSLSVTTHTPVVQADASIEVTKRSLNVTAQSVGINADAIISVDKKSLLVTAGSVAVSSVSRTCLKLKTVKKIPVPNIAIQICDRLTGREISSRRYTGKSLKSEMYGLTPTFVFPGGPGTMQFKLKRDPRDYWPDLEPSNIIKMWYEGELKWAGEIEGIVRNIEKESEFSVDCLGWAALLKLMGPPADHDYDLDPGEKLSEYLVRCILADTSLGFTEGNIDSNDFVIVSGRVYYPGKCWWDIIDDGNKFSGYDWWVDPYKRFHFQPKSSTPDYYVNLSDCVKSSLDKKRGDGLRNWIQYGYAPVSTTYYVTSEDTDSQQRHGKRCKWETISGICTEDEAQQAADVYISLHSKLKPSSSITTDRIRNRNKVFISPFDVEYGKILQVPDMLSDEENIYNAQVVNETSTWQMMEVAMNIDEMNVSLSPGGAQTRLDVMLAKLEARSRY